MSFKSRRANEMLFHAYVPTRDADSLELRVCSSMGGPIEFMIDGHNRSIDSPSVSQGGLHFYRQTIEPLPSGTPFVIIVRHCQSGMEKAVETSMLKLPSGRLKLKIGVLADLHLPEHAVSIDRYSPGTRRFGGLASELGHKYIKRLVALGADIIVLPGDLVEPCNRQTLSQLQELMNSVSVPCYPIIGNHEPWSPNGAALFRDFLGLPSHGYYSACHGDCRLIMLDSPDPGALANRSAQLRWLKSEIEKSGPHETIVIFSHFSLLLHPCVQGHKNDGYQLLDNHRQILKTVEEFPNVRLFIAGHKNVPSVVVRNSIVHTLSPQLIQFPCGYDLFRVFDDGVMRTTYEIDEQHYVELARTGYAHNWEERYGAERGRNFFIEFT